MVLSSQAGKPERRASREFGTAAPVPRDTTHSGRDFENSRRASNTATAVGLLLAMAPSMSRISASTS